MTAYPQQSSGRHLARILLWLLLAIVLCILAAVVDGQEPSRQPDAPQPVLIHHPDRILRTLLAVDATSRSLDVYSTHQMLSQGGRELLLPKFIADHPPVMAGIEAGNLIGVWLGSRWLERQGHRRLTWLLVGLDAGQNAPWAIHNLFIKPAKTTNLKEREIQR